MLNNSFETTFRRLGLTRYERNYLEQPLQKRAFSALGNKFLTRDSILKWFSKSACEIPLKRQVIRDTLP